MPGAGHRPYVSEETAWQMFLTGKYSGRYTQFVSESNTIGKWLALVQV